jgi:NADH:ubiquinone oxidoreductase subunit
MKTFKDELGNTYYEKKGRRSVVYAKNQNPSTLPPRFYIWLHYYTDTLMEPIFLPQRMEYKKETNSSVWKPR